MALRARRWLQDARYGVGAAAEKRRFVICLVDSSAGTGAAFHSGGIGGSHIHLYYADAAIFNITASV